jgi:hypothetical protein
MPRHQVYRAIGDLTTLQHSSVHPNPPINLQIKPTTAEGSVHLSSNGSQPSAAPVYHANIHTLANLRGSLLSRRRFSLSSNLSPPAA